MWSHQLTRPRACIFPYSAQLATCVQGCRTASFLWPAKSVGSRVTCCLSGGGLRFWARGGRGMWAVEMGSDNWACLNFLKRD